MERHTLLAPEVPVCAPSETFNLDFAKRHSEEIRRVYSLLAANAHLHICSRNGILVVGNEARPFPRAARECEGVVLELQVALMLRILVNIYRQNFYFLVLGIVDVFLCQKI